MNKRIELLIHAAVWAVLFLLPLTFLSRGGSINVAHYLMICMGTVLMMVVFYADYLWLTPHYFATGRHRYYWLSNIVMVVALGVVMHYWMAFTHSLFDTGARMHRYEPSVIDTLLFILRDVFNLTIAAAIATALALAMRWQKAEAARPAVLARKAARPARKAARLVRTAVRPGPAARLRKAQIRSEAPGLETQHWTP